MKPTFTFCKYKPTLKPIISDPYVAQASAGTTYNFVRSVPLVIVVSAVSLSDLHLSANGIVLAVLSGAITSGVGYAIWYTALRSISSMQAAMVQLSVPILAAACRPHDRGWGIGNHGIRGVTCSPTRDCDPGGVSEVRGASFGSERRFRSRRGC